MTLTKEFDELQRLFAQNDLLTEPRRSVKSGFMEILLAKRKKMKIKIYQEQGHQFPHIHIDYGKQHHAASFSIESGSRLEGNLLKSMTTMCLDDVSSWLERNRSIILEIWHTLQVGGNHNQLVESLPGDV